MVKPADKSPKWLLKLSEAIATIMGSWLKTQIGDDAVEYIHDRTYLSEQLDNALYRTEETLLQNSDLPANIREALNSLTVADLPPVRNTLHKFYQNPSDPELGEALRPQIQVINRNLPAEDIANATELYVAALREEIISISSTVRDKMKTWAALKTERHTARIPEIEKALNDISDMIKEYTGKPQFQLRSPLPEYTPPPLPAKDILPKPGELPPGYRMPFDRNALFIGRVEDMKLLADALLYNPANVGFAAIQARAAITGTGGIGKTQLAVEFCYRYGRYFHGVHWIDASNDLEFEITACGLAMNLAEWSGITNEQVEVTLAAWRKGGPRLVVLDNLDEPERLRIWLPKLGAIRLLVTSRCNQFPPEWGLTSQSLDVFSPTDGQELLRQLAPRLKTVAYIELDKLGKRLGWLPLALDLVGRYFNDRKTLDIDAYIQELDVQGSSLGHEAFVNWSRWLPTGHSPNLMATFAMSWECLKGEDDELARRVFCGCGHCAPNTPIPYQLLAEAFGGGSSLDKALRRLSQLGLVEESKMGSIMIHPLLGEYGRWINRYLEWTADYAESCSDEEAYGEVHLDLDRDVNVNNLGHVLRALGDLVGAKVCFERVLKIDESVYGEVHPAVAKDVSNLGGVLQELGDLIGAKACYQRALGTWERFLPPEHRYIQLTRRSLSLLEEEIRKMRK